MHDNRELVEARITRLLRDRLRPAAWSETRSLAVEAWEVPGAPVSVAEARRAPFHSFRPGAVWGPPWSTTWFRVSGRVPERWLGRELEVVIDLGFDNPSPGFSCEGIVWPALPGSVDAPIRGLHPRHHTIRLQPGAQEVGLLVEAVSNPTLLVGFRPTPLGHPATAGDQPLYRFRRADVTLRDEEVSRLVQEVEVLRALMRTMTQDSPKRHQLLRTLERAVDALDLDDVSGTASRAREVLARVLALPAEASAHRFAAVGHAHIDTAWLWPISEARRKVARTFANVLALLEDNPDMVFAGSQPQHYSWLEQDHPALFDQVRKHVARGAWAPVGGMWVEPDCNLPSGESLVRQLIHGKRWFKERLDADVNNVWLPDAFGFPASLPQVMHHAGCEFFMTAKLGWNETNHIPHDTFWWEGIDGTRVLAHLPPCDNYSGTLAPAELVRAAETFAEKGVATGSLMPFGYGDGGGGPTQEMVDRARILSDLEGSPRIAFRAPADFFAHALEDYPNPPVWRGELYFERHRGIYTTQQRTKMLHRRLEGALREAELWLATAGETTWSAAVDQLDGLWKCLLVHQFHDILPGSSTSWVHEQAEQALSQALATTTSLTARALAELVGQGDVRTVANASDVFRAEVIEIEGEPVWVEVPPLGLARVKDGAAHGDRVRADLTGLRNGLLDVRVGPDGTLTSVQDLRTGRDLLAPGRRGNVLRLHPDKPIMFDAWDVDAPAFEQYTEVDDVESVEVVDEGPLVARIRVRRRIGKASMIEQTYVLRAGSRRLDIVNDVDWHESDALLTVVFPADVRADECRYGIQFGHVGRPVHENTSWDAARFEVPAHGWAHLAEAGFGVALLDDGIYGHGCQGNELRLSLLRAPGFPDPNADRGRHQLTYAVMATDGRLDDVIEEAHRLEVPLRVVMGGEATTLPAPLVSVSGARISAVKRADDKAGDLVIRCWEPRGGRTALKVEGRGWTSIRRCDALEQPTGSPEESQPVRLAPFELVTLRLSAVGVPPSHGASE